MRRTQAWPCLAPALALVAGVSLSARAATVGEVNALVEKANSALTDRQGDRAAKLQDAIDTCREALELLEKVPGLSDEARDKKATEIMSVIYWCRKMKPLDLSGRERATKREQAGGGLQSSQDEGKAPEQEEKQTEFDRLAFERAKKYASSHPDDLEGTLLRFEGVAASYPRTEWGKKALGEAESARKKLDAAREAVLAACSKQIARLELKQALAALNADIGRERNASRKAQLMQLKADVTALDSLWQRVARGLEGLTMTMHHPLSEIGIDKKGWILKGGPEGVQVAMGTKNATPSLMKWGEVGAGPMVHLGKKLMNMKDPEALEGMAVGATVAGDFMLAQAMFGDLMSLAPERVTGVVGYFERAQSGYRSSAEGSANIRLDEAKKLARQRKFPEAMAILNALREDLAKNSSLPEYLTEVSNFRRQTMRRNKVNDEGQPISAFEKQVRAVFGGDVKLDQQSGAIEVVYDFEDKGQLRDWQVARQFEQVERKGGWTIMQGKAQCLGLNKALLVWKFPVSEFDIQADVTYLSEHDRVVVCAGMSRSNPFGVWAWCKGGRARLGTGKIGMYGWYSNARFIWRPGEVASLQFTDGDGRYPYNLTVNGEWAIAGRPWDDVEPGPVAFGFDGGRGTVDNVVIKGTLDMKWFLTNTLRGGR